MLAFATTRHLSCAAPKLGFKMRNGTPMTERVVPELGHRRESGA
jgi:hypothetical protein